MGSSRTRTYPEFNNNAAAVHPAVALAFARTSEGVKSETEKESEKNKNSVATTDGWDGGRVGGFATLRRNARTNDARH